MASNNLIQIRVDATELTESLNNVSEDLMRQVSDDITKTVEQTLFQQVFNQSMIRLGNHVTQAFQNLGVSAGEASRALAGLESAFETIPDVIPIPLDDERAERIARTELHATFNHKPVQPAPANRRAIAFGRIPR